MTGGVGQPDVVTLSQLERELKPDQGKFLFRKEEAGEQIADFYHRYMASPLRRDLAKQPPERPCYGTSLSRISTLCPTIGR
jgi:hypothetical protein